MQFGSRAIVVMLSEQSVLFSLPLLAVTHTVSRLTVPVLLWTCLGLHSIKFCSGCPGAVESKNCSRLSV